LTTSDPALFATAAGSRVCAGHSAFNHSYNYRSVPIALMRIKLDQVSAKIRDAYPDEETVDPDWPVWVGVIPARLVFGAPLPDPARNRVAIAPEQGAGFRSKDDLRPACGAPPTAGVRT
jgi:hypothetical protein